MESRLPRVCVLAAWLFSLAQCLSPTLAQAVPLDGLLAYFPFDGNANDQSGHGNDGTVFGASLAADRFGTPDSAFRFDGADFIQVVGSSSALNVQTALTLSAWVEPTSMGAGFEHIVNKTDFPDTGYRLAAWYANPTGNAVELFDTEGAQHIVDDGELPLVGSWTHIAATWDGSTISIYRNGVLRGSAPFTGTISPSSNDLFIGVNPVLGKQGYFVGSIDEVAIYDRALSPAEIRGLAGVAEPGTLTLMLAGLATALGLARALRPYTGFDRIG